MDDKLITQAGLSRELNVSKPYISKLVKAGRFDGCFAPDGKKLYLSKALTAYNRGLTKAERKPKKVQKTVKNTEKTVKNTQKVVKSDEEIDDLWADFDEEVEGVYNTDNIKELKKLLKKASSPMHRAQIESTFWQAKTRRLAFLEQERELIPIMEAKQAVESVFTPINVQLDNMPTQLKAHFPEVAEEVVKWLWNEIDSIKTASAVEWETA